MAEPEAAAAAAAERFAATTGATRAEAEFFLEAAGGQWERAVAMFRDQLGPRQRRGVSGGGAPPARVPPRPRAPSARGAPPPRGPLQAALGLPLAAAAAGLRLALRALGAGLAAAGAVVRAVLPPPLARVLAGAGRALLHGPMPSDPAAAAAEFSTAWAARQGPGAGPAWVAVGWHAAAADAAAQGKLLFAYLHAHAHQDAAAFCAGTLCDPEFAAYVNENFVAWGGDLRSADALRLAAALRAPAYPYVALLAPGGGGARLVAGAAGAAAPATLAAALRAGAGAAGEELAAGRAAAEARDRDRALRAEQEADFAAALEADRAREAAAAEAAVAERTAAAAAAAAAASAAAAAAAAAARASAAAAALDARRAAAAAALPAEPVAGTPGAALLRLRLPEGATCTRRFLAADPLAAVSTWVDSLEGLRHARYRLAVLAPRRVFGAADLGESLAALGLTPQAALYLQPAEEGEDALQGGAATAGGE
jgi:FAS-associated factor 2